MLGHGKGDKMSKDYNEKKLRELILYAAMRSEDDPKFGAIKLNKILFFADFTAYAQTGKSISGAAYRALEHGPAPTKLVPVKKKLERDEDAFEYTKLVAGGFEQKRLLARRQPELGMFSPEEVSLIDDVITRLWDYCAKEASDLSHQFAGWQLADVGEDIPYESVCIPSEPIRLTPEERARGNRVAQRLSDAA